MAIYYYIWGTFMNDLVQAGIKAILAGPELLKEIYSDLCKPGAAQLGKAIGGILGLGNTALYPIHLMNERTAIRLRANFERYRKKMENVPEEDVIPVPPEIGVPIAEKLVYVSNDELADMYTSLLAKASSKVNSDQAHPGFVAMIDRLSPDEAILLKKFRQDIAFVEVRFTYEDGSWETLKDLAIGEPFYRDLQQPENMAAYLANFSALGIIEIHRDSHHIPVEKVYPPLKKYHEAEFADRSSSPSGRPGKVDCHNAHLSITAIGKLFMKACFSAMKQP